jgi:hypothetical protein
VIIDLAFACSGFHFSLQMPQYNVGANVQGRTAAVRGKKGTVKECMGSGHAIRYTIDWDDGTSQTVTAKAIQPEGSVVAPARTADNSGKRAKKRSRLLAGYDLGGDGEGNEEEEVDDSSSSGSGESSEAEAAAMMRGGLCFVF